MNKKPETKWMICLLLTVIFFMLFSSKDIIESVTFSISIWKDNLFPTLFPFFVVSNSLMQYGFLEIIGNKMQFFMSKFFHLPKECSFAFAVSLLSGFPSGAKYTKDLVENHIITPEEGSRLLTFTHYSNPLFIIGMIGNLLLNNPIAATLILLAHISSGFLTGILMNYSYPPPTKNSPKKLSQLENHLSFGELLQNSIFDSLHTMFLLLGVVTIFLILTTIINKVFSLPPIFHAIFAGILEMTQGIQLTSQLSISELQKIIFITGFLSFGGLSVHTQVISIISSCKIKYKPFLLARITHSILAMVFVSIFYFIIYCSYH